MRSAQRQRRLRQKARNNGVLTIIKFLVVPAILIFVFLLFKLSTRYWNGSDKIGFVYRQQSGDVAVTVLDPKLSEETTMVIPGDTQVDVAGNYGTLRIKNVWQLAQNEKLDGRLLAGTVTKNFLFPVFLWSDSDAQNLADANLAGTLKFIFAPKKTNIPLGDRAAIGLFAIQVKSINKTEINLGTSKFLQKTVLNDGEKGYLLAGPISERLTVYFSDNDFADESLKVEITDSTGAFGVSDKVGQIIQVLGGKIVSVDKKPVPSNFDCIILGKNSKIVRKIADLFRCSISREDSVFDLEVRLGEAFAKRF